MVSMFLSPTLGKGKSSSHSRNRTRSLEGFCICLGFSMCFPNFPSDWDFFHLFSISTTHPHSVFSRAPGVFLVHVRKPAQDPNQNKIQLSGCGSNIIFKHSNGCGNSGSKWFHLHSHTNHTPSTVKRSKKSLENHVSPKAIFQLNRPKFDSFAPEKYLPNRTVVFQPPFFRGYVKLQGDKPPNHPSQTCHFVFHPIPRRQRINETPKFRCCNTEQTKRNHQEMV